jgi:hypothetical protein
MNGDHSKNRPPGFLSLFRGLYSRVVQRLGVHPSYVSRVARGERKSNAVTAALSKEIWKIIELTGNHDGNHPDGTSRVAAKRNATKKEANLTVASVKKAMAQPRFAKSARNEETSHLVTKRAKKPAPQIISSASS